MREVAASPRPVTRGESPPEISVSIDALNFTVPNGNADDICKEVAQLVGATGESLGRGMHGYANRVDFDGYANVCHGGEHQRGTVLVSINGKGCGRIASFDRLSAWAESLSARITRVDIAADDHNAQALDVARAISGWREGAFISRGRAPNARLIDDFGSGEGKTFNVGARLSGKLCRVYEKGRQLGDPQSRWVRAEVEFHNKDRVLTWDMVTNPLPWLAGAYPFFARLSLVAERLKTFKRATEITIQAVRRWVKESAGRSINALLHDAGGDLYAVFQSIKREGVPRRLHGYWQPGAGVVCA